ncbi:MAG: ATP-binding cassette domain-containing protein [Christensenellales bacterium]
MERILEVRGLKKSYGEVRAVKGIDFYVERGSLFAFLGPNGAGKTTTIEIICTLIRPDAGTVRINGYELAKDDTEIRKQIGIVFQDSLLDRLLTVKENLMVRGSFYGYVGQRLRDAVSRAAKAAEAEGFLNRPYGKLSGGQRRRADIARALVNTPKILFLDEPTTGLDPQTRKSVWGTIKKLQTETDMTVFLTTHYMEEAAKADYVFVIDDGEIAAKGTPAELREKYSTDHLVIRTEQSEKLTAHLIEAGLPYTQEAGTVTVTLEKTLDAIPVLDACRNSIDAFEVISGSMDDAFIGITGKEMRE